jgi:transcription elongation factor GreB
VEETAVSRAFVKDDQGDAVTGEAVPERVQSGLPNYVTPRGLAALSRKVETLLTERAQAELLDDEDLRRQQVAHVDRELRYFQARLDGAIPVDPGHLPDDHVHFGSEVTVAEDEGQEHVFVIVGEDEADPSKGWVSWASPLARALMNARVGDVVTWVRPSGSKEVEIVAIRKAPLDQG